MKKIIHITLVLVLLLSCRWMKAQNVVRETWNDVDFSDTTLVDSESFRVRMLNELYLNTMTDDLARFDSLSPERGSPVGQSQSQHEGLRVYIGVYVEWLHQSWKNTSY